jgi:hypothetical protein
MQPTSNALLKKSSELDFFSRVNEHARRAGAVNAARRDGSAASVIELFCHGP